jgi:hypothetical protein
MRWRSKEFLDRTQATGALPFTRWGRASPGRATLLPDASYLTVGTPGLLVSPAEPSSADADVGPRRVWGLAGVGRGAVSAQMTGKPRASRSSTQCLRVARKSRPALWAGATRISMSRRRSSTIGAAAAVTFGRKIPPIRPAATNSSCVRLARSRWRRRMNRLPGPRQRRRGGVRGHGHDRPPWRIPVTEPCPCPAPALADREVRQARSRSAARTCRRTTAAGCRGARS